jgi:hypothetical protein
MRTGSPVPGLAHVQPGPKRPFDLPGQVRFGNAFYKQSIATTSVATSAMAAISRRVMRCQFIPLVSFGRAPGAKLVALGLERFTTSLGR